MLAARLHDRPAAPARVGLAELHLHAGHGLDVPVFVPDDLGRVREQFEDDSFFFCVMHFFDPGGHLFFAAAVDDGDVLCAEPLGAARRVHGHVAAADDHRIFTHLHGRIRFGEMIRLHEVDARQKLIGGIHAVEVFARNALKPRKSRATADEHRVEPLFFEQFVQRDRAADDHVGLDFDPDVLQGFDFVPHELLGQTKLRNAVNEHAAGRMQRLEHRDLVAELAQIARTGQPRGAAADDRDLFAVIRQGFRGLGAVRHCIVRHETLEPADADGLALDAAHALLLALRLLRADAAANGGQRVGGADDLVGLHELTFRYELDKLRNPYVHRAAGNAGLMLAVEATLGFVDGHGLVVALRHLVEILIAHVRRLLARGQLRHSHVRHVSFLPAWSGVPHP